MLLMTVHLSNGLVVKADKNRIILYIGGPSPARLFVRTLGCALSTWDVKRLVPLGLFDVLKAL